MSWVEHKFENTFEESLNDIVVFLYHNFMHDIKLQNFHKLENLVIPIPTPTVNMITNDEEMSRTNTRTKKVRPFCDLCKDYVGTFSLKLDESIYSLVVTATCHGVRNTVTMSLI